MRAVVLGGGKCHPDLFLATKEKYKAEIKLNGKPLVQYVVDALLGSEHIDSIDLYLEREDWLDKDINVRLSSKNPIDNIKDFVERNQDDHFLVCTSDLPLLKPDIVDKFVKDFGSLNQKFVVPIINKVEIKKRFPKMRRTYITIGGKKWCIGNIFIIQRDFFLGNANMAKLLFTHRKSILKSGKIFGWRLLFRLLVRRLSFAFIEAETKRRFGHSVMPVVLDGIETAVDLDKISDYSIIRRYLERKERFLK